MSFHILVCAKLVADPEVPPSSMEVNVEEKRVIVRGASPVISPFDESALEAAIRIKETHEAKITLLTAGRNLSKAVILKAMATGVDEAIIAEDNALDPALLDSWSTARILAELAKQAGSFDLILTGRQAADTNAGQVGTGLSCFLNIPAVTVAQKIEMADHKVIVERVLPNGFEVVEAFTPALVTVGGELGELRLPNVKSMKAAKQLPQKIFSLNDLQIDVFEQATVETTELAPPSRERDCVLVEGETQEEAGKNLAQKLREEKII